MVGKPCIWVAFKYRDIWERCSQDGRWRWCEVRHCSQARWHWGWQYMTTLPHSHNNKAINHSAVKFNYNATKKIGFRHRHFGYYTDYWFHQQHKQISQLKEEWTDIDTKINTGSLEIKGFFRTLKLNSVSTFIIWQHEADADSAVMLLSNKIKATLICFNSKNYLHDDSLYWKHGSLKIPHAMSQSLGRTIWLGYFHIIEKFNMHQKADRGQWCMGVLYSARLYL